jgi:hypothetical protein
MWPFAEMSLSTATLVGTLANWGLLASLIAGVISTFLIVKTADVKEEHWDKLREASSERIAEANARALEAGLALEKFKAPRQLKGDEFVKALEGKPKAPVEIVFVRDDPECWQLAMQIRDWLKTAKWEYSEPAAITGPDEARFASYPSAMQAGGQPRGVTIVQRVTTQADFEREKGNPFDPNDPIDTPMKALSRALMGSLGGIGGSMNFDTGRVGVLRVVVGPKP